MGCTQLKISQIKVAPSLFTYGQYSFIDS